VSNAYSKNKPGRTFQSGLALNQKLPGRVQKIRAVAGRAGLLMAPSVHFPAINVRACQRLHAPQFLREIGSLPPNPNPDVAQEFPSLTP
jgi:hypothetical protein